MLWIGIMLTPILIKILPQVLHMLENKKAFIHTQLQLCVYNIKQIDKKTT